MHMQYAGSTASCQAISGTKSIIISMLNILNKRKIKRIAWFISKQTLLHLKVAS